MTIKYTQKIAQPNYYELVKLFDCRFEKIEIKTLNLKYQTMLRLKINLRLKMNINFLTHLSLIEKGKITCVILTINSKKNIIGSVLMFGLVTVITYLIQPGFFSLLFGIISGLIVYFIVNIQLKRELKGYLNNLLQVSG